MNVHGDCDCTHPVYTGHSFQTRVHTSCSLHTSPMARCWTKSDSPTEHHKTCTYVAILEISTFLSNLVETIQHVQKLSEGPHGKQHDYISFVTLGNRPEKAERPIYYTHSPTGILLQKDMARKCPVYMDHEGLCCLFSLPTQCNFNEKLTPYKAATPGLSSFVDSGCQSSLRWLMTWHYFLCFPSASSQSIQYLWLPATAPVVYVSLVYSRAGGCLNTGGDENLWNFTADITATTILPASDKLHSVQSTENPLSKDKSIDQLLLGMKALSGIILIAKQILKGRSSKQQEKLCMQLHS